MFVCPIDALKNNNVDAKITIVVVGKGHHVRFFPKRLSKPFHYWLPATDDVLPSQQDADKSGNCPSGLLVDDHITNPNYQDFYLQSHSGLLGSMSIL